MTTERLDYYAPDALSTVFYDFVSQFDPTLAGEVDFYAELVPAGSWVLELGCGTGRITLPLAERNYAVVGLDLSRAMLARAEAKRAKAPPEITARTAFVLGDMSNFKIDHQFDAVISPFFSLSHLPRGAARKRTMERIARHLRPGGICALHAVLPGRVESPEAIDPAKPVLDAAYDPAGNRLRMEVVGQGFDAATSRFDQRIDYVQLDPEGREVRRSPERLTYYVSNLESDARGLGLVLERKISPFNAVGEMWIFRRR